MISISISDRSELLKANFIRKIDMIQHFLVDISHEIMQTSIM